ncbi:hypothetical protein GWI33_020391 [Rhynchophorus ferrugineus]|uniref:Uncharacterized protein n=1 Tax=Rhynchophorus ferrugineus TaxID=354439 RepID=A0A834HWN6_RHYFE|nr:hypothetical protein GWI33_020391 [Rhynchophorus ferrugineus]
MLVKSRRKGREEKVIKPSPRDGTKAKEPVTEIATKEDEETKKKPKSKRAKSREKKEGPAKRDQLAEPSDSGGPDEEEPTTETMGKDGEKPQKSTTQKPKKKQKGPTKSETRGPVTETKDKPEKITAQEPKKEQKGPRESKPLSQPSESDRTKEQEPVTDTVEKYEKPEKATAQEPKKKQKGRTKSEQISQPSDSGRTKDNEPVTETLEKYVEKPEKRTTQEPKKKQKGPIKREQLLQPSESGRTQEDEPVTETIEQYGKPEKITEQEPKKKQKGLTRSEPKLTQKLEEPIKSKRESKEKGLTKSEPKLTQKLEEPTKSKPKLVEPKAKDKGPTKSESKLMPAEESTESKQDIVKPKEKDALKPGQVRGRGKLKYQPSTSGVVGEIKEDVITKREEPGQQTKPAEKTESQLVRDQTESMKEKRKQPKPSQSDRIRTTEPLQVILKADQQQTVLADSKEPKGQPDTAKSKLELPTETTLEDAEDDKKKKGGREKLTKEKSEDKKPLALIDKAKEKLRKKKKSKVGDKTADEIESPSAREDEEVDEEPIKPDTTGYTEPFKPYEAKKIEPAKKSMTHIDSEQKYQPKETASSKTVVKKEPKISSPRPVEEDKKSELKVDEDISEKPLEEEIKEPKMKKQPEKRDKLVDFEKIKEKSSKILKKRKPKDKKELEGYDDSAGEGIEQEEIAGPTDEQTGVSPEAGSIPIEEIKKPSDIPAKVKEKKAIITPLSEKKYDEAEAGSTTMEEMIEPSDIFAKVKEKKVKITPSSEKEYDEDKKEKISEMPKEAPIGEEGTKMADKPTREKADKDIIAKIKKKVAPKKSKELRSTDSRVEEQPSIDEHIQEIPTEIDQRGQQGIDITVPDYLEDKTQLSDEDEWIPVKAKKKRRKGKLEEEPSQIAGDDITEKTDELDKDKVVPEKSKVFDKLEEKLTKLKPKSSKRKLKPSPSAVEQEEIELQQPQELDTGETPPVLKTKEQKLPIDKKPIAEIPLKPAEISDIEREKDKIEVTETPVKEIKKPTSILEKPKTEEAIPEEVQIQDYIDKDTVQKVQADKKPEPVAELPKEIYLDAEDVTQQEEIQPPPEKQLAAKDITVAEKKEEPKEGKPDELVSSREGIGMIEKISSVETQKPPEEAVEIDEDTYKTAEESLPSDQFYEVKSDVQERIPKREQEEEISDVHEQKPVAVEEAKPKLGPFFGKGCRARCAQLKFQRKTEDQLLEQDSEPEYVLIKDEPIEEEVVTKTLDEEALIKSEESLKVPETTSLPEIHEEIVREKPTQPIRILDQEELPTRTSVTDLIKETVIVQQPVTLDLSKKESKHEEPIQVTEERPVQITPIEQDRLLSPELQIQVSIEPPGEQEYVKDAQPTKLLSESEDEQLVKITEDITSIEEDLMYPRILDIKKEPQLKQLPMQMSEEISDRKEHVEEDQPIISDIMKEKPDVDELSIPKSAERLEEEKEPIKSTTEEYVSFESIKKIEEEVKKVGHICKAPCRNALERPTLFGEETGGVVVKSDLETPRDNIPTGYYLADDLSPRQSLPQWANLDEPELTTSMSISDTHLSASTETDKAIWLVPKTDEKLYENRKEITITSDMPSQTDNITEHEISEIPRDVQMGSVMSKILSGQIAQLPSRGIIHMESRAPQSLSEAIYRHICKAKCSRKPTQNILDERKQIETMEDVTDLETDSEMADEANIVATEVLDEIQNRIFSTDVERLKEDVLNDDDVTSTEEQPKDTLTQPKLKDSAEELDRKQPSFADKEDNAYDEQKEITTTPEIISEEALKDETKSITDKANIIEKQKDEGETSSYTDSKIKLSIVDEDDTEAHVIQKPITEEDDVEDDIPSEGPFKEPDYVSLELQSTPEEVPPEKDVIPNTEETVDVSSATSFERLVPNTIESIPEEDIAETQEKETFTDALEETSDTAITETIDKTNMLSQTSFEVLDSNVVDLPSISEGHLIQIPQEEPFTDTFDKTEDIAASITYNKVDASSKTSIDELNTRAVMLATIPEEDVTDISQDENFTDALDQAVPLAEPESSRFVLITIPDEDIVEVPQTEPKSDGFVLVSMPDESILPDSKAEDLTGLLPKELDSNVLILTGIAEDQSGTTEVDLENVEKPIKECTVLGIIEQEDVFEDAHSYLPTQSTSTSPEIEYPIRVDSKDAATIYDKAIKKAPKPTPIIAQPVPRFASWFMPTKTDKSKPICRQPCNTADESTSSYPSTSAASTSTKPEYSQIKSTCTTADEIASAVSICKAICKKVQKQYEESQGQFKIPKVKIFKDEPSTSSGKRAEPCRASCSKPPQSNLNETETTDIVSESIEKINHSLNQLTAVPQKTQARTCRANREAELNALRNEVAVSSSLIFLHHSPLSLLSTHL